LIAIVYGAAEQCDLCDLLTKLFIHIDKMSPIYHMSSKSNPVAYDFVDSRIEMNGTIQSQVVFILIVLCSVILFLIIFFLWAYFLYSFFTVILHQYQSMRVDRIAIAETAVVHDCYRM
jgi:hypothetical protein